MGASPVKSRNIEVFPKKLWIHNSAKKLEVEKWGGIYPINSPATVVPDGGLSYVTNWIDTGKPLIQAAFTTGAMAQDQSPIGSVIITTCSVDIDGTRFRVDGGARNVVTVDIYINAIFVVVLLFYKA